MQSGHHMLRQQQQQQRNGSRQGTNRLQSGNRQPSGYPSQNGKHGAGMNYGGIPKNVNAPQRGWQMRKQEPLGHVADPPHLADMKVSPKFNNNMLGNGNGNHHPGRGGGIGNGGSIFDQQEEMHNQIVNHKNAKMAKGSIDPADVLVENEMLRSELQKMKDKMIQMEKIVKDKDAMINKQRTDLTNLRKKNFDFRSKITELEDKAKNDVNAAGARQGSRNPKPHHRQGGGMGAGGGNEAREELALAMQMQRQEMMEREKQMIMMTMMDSMLGAQGVEAEEQRLLQQAIEASRGDADPNNPNTDNMTYEELLQLEDRNGKVSKGLTPAQIKSIKEGTWMKRGDTVEDACSICFENFERHQKFKKLPRCPHEYHSQCIDKWLEAEKRCPICNETVLN